MGAATNAPRAADAPRVGAPQPRGVRDDAVTADAGTLEVTLDLSEELLQLMPPPPAGGWSVRMPPTPPATEWLRRWEYPPVRRAQRLSYMSAALVPSIDRQRLLQASSVRERLQIAIVALSEARRRLVAVTALEAMRRGDGRGDGRGDDADDGHEPGGLTFGI